MKKIVFLSILLCSISSVGFAQDGESDYRSSLKLGLKAGLNYSNVYDSKGEEYDANGKFGAVAGAFLTIPIGKYLGIQPEFLFSQKGYKASGNLGGLAYEFKHTSNYLDIPLLVQLKPVSALTIVAGPQYSFLLKEKNEFTSSLLNTVQEEEFKNDNVRKNVLCFIGGLDLHLSPVVLGARVGWDIQNNNGDGTSTIPRYKNVWYQMTVGIMF